MSARRPPLHLRELNQAREYYNPMRRLDVPRLVRMFEQGERGQYSDLQKFYRVAEKKYAVLRALKSRRAGAMKKLDTNVKPMVKLPKGFTAAQADAQAEVLRSAYDQIVNLPQAIDHLALATFRGFAFLEKHYLDGDPRAGIERLQPVPQWFWFRDYDDWGWRYDPTARDDRSRGEAIDPADFVLREIDDPLNEIAALSFVRANMSAKDWDAFCDDYAIPSIFAMLGENTPAEHVERWLALVETVTKNSRGALPPGSKVETLEAGNADGKQFQAHMEWQRSEVVLAGTSGLLTMLTAPDSGTLAGGAHQDAFDLIAIAEAMEISAILQEQIDLPLLQREFPSQPPLAYFELASEEEEDLDKVAKRLADLKTAGFEADAKEVSELFGLTLTKAAPVAVGAGLGPDGKIKQPDNTQPAPAADDEALKNRALPVDANRAVFDRHAQRQLSAAQAEAVGPVLDRIAALAAAPDFAAALAQLEADLPRLKAEARIAAPDVAAVWDQVLLAAFVDGFADQPTAGSRTNENLASNSPASGPAAAPTPHNAS